MKRARARVGTPVPGPFGVWEPDPEMFEVPLVTASIQGDVEDIDQEVDP